MSVISTSSTYVTSDPNSLFNAAKKAKELESKKLSLSSDDGFHLTLTPWVSSDPEVLELEAFNPLTPTNNCLYLTEDEIKQIVRWIYDVYGIGVIKYNPITFTPNTGYNPNEFTPHITSYNAKAKLWETDGTAAVPYGC